MRGRQYQKDGFGVARLHGYKGGSRQCHLSMEVDVIHVEVVYHLRVNSGPGLLSGERA